MAGPAMLPGYPFIKSMVFISPKMIHVLQLMHKKVILCILVLFLCGNDWLTLLELSWQCALKVFTPELWMYYPVITLKATTAAISDDLPYLFYIALRVIVRNGLSNVALQWYRWLSTALEIWNTLHLPNWQDYLLKIEFKSFPTVYDMPISLNIGVSYTIGKLLNSAF